MGKVRVLVAVVAALALLGAACGDDDGGEVRSEGGGSESGSGSPSGTGSPSGVEEPECEPVGDPADADTTVEVSLGEWFVTLSDDRVPAGAVHFFITNEGADAHEMVIARADTPEDLPTGGEGHGVDEDALEEAGDLVGEVEPFPGQSECHGTFELEAGTYQLFCAILEEEDGETEDHFAEGMVATLVVE